MEFEVALQQELSVITELGDRIYPLTSPEATKKNGVPYVIFVSSEGLRKKSLSEGYLSGKEVSGELNIIANRYSEMKSMSKQVISILINMEQRVIGTNGPYIQELTYQAPVEIYEEIPNLYRSNIEFSVYFEEV